MNIMELLQLLDARLKLLAFADENAIQSVLEEVAAGPRPEGVAPDVAPDAVLAGRLVSIEQECRTLREHLHVQLTPAARCEVRNISFGPLRSRPTPAGPNEPEKPN